jgi:hypothetical protein
MAGPDPIRADVRRARARRRTPPGSVCVYCGEQNPLLLQAHHVAGNANDKALTVVLCRNHHHLNTLGHLDLGVDLAPAEDALDVDLLIGVLRGLAVFFVLLAEVLVAWADRLDARVHSLDANCPTWRQVPPAA